MANSEFQPVKGKRKRRNVDIVDLSSVNTQHNRDDTSDTTSQNRFKLLGDLII